MIRLGFYSAALFFTVIFFSPFTVPAAELPITVSRITLPIDGSNIAVEVFAPAGALSSPAILVLHGAGGTLLDGPEMRRLARHLAGAGNAVYLVHYFDRTGTLFARDGTMQKNFELWSKTVRGSIVAIQNLRKDSAPVGIYGYSLGGFLALVAGSDNPRVAAVVEHAGGVWNGKMERIGKMPAVLMIHGQRDARVPFEKYAKPLIPVMRARARKLETRFFPDEGHVFNASALLQVREESARFFAKYLERNQRTRLR